MYPPPLPRPLGGMLSPMPIKLSIVIDVVPWSVVRSILASLKRVRVRLTALPLGALKIWGKCTPNFSPP